MTDDYRYYFLVKRPGKIPEIKRPINDQKAADFGRELLAHNPDAVIIYLTITPNDVWPQALSEMLTMDDMYKQMAIDQAAVTKRNRDFLTDIEARFGAKYRKGLEKCITEDNSFSDYAELKIVTTPAGKPQAENYGPVRKVWIDQYGPGPCGDDYHGTIDFPLPDNTFVRIPFSC